MKKAPFFIYFVLHACLSLTLGVYALGVAAGSLGNLLARFSEATVALFAWFSGLFGLSIFLAVYSRKHPEKINTIAGWFVARPVLFWAVQVVLVLTTILAILLSSLNPESLHTAAPYYLRLQPVLLWLALFSMLTLLFLSVLKYPDAGRQIRQVWVLIGEDGRKLIAALKPEPGEKIYLYALLGLILLALLDRLVFLNQPIRYDEARSFFYYASKPLLVPITIYDAPNNHVFHSILMNIAFHLFGKAVWALRLPVLLAGILVVPAAYLAGRTLFNRQAAILSAALVVSSMSLIEFSTNARGYIFVALFSLLLVSLGQYLKTHHNRVAWALLVILSALGFYSVPTMLYPFGGVMLWLALSGLLGETGKTYARGFFRPLIFAGVGVVILTFLLYAPILQVSGIRSLIANEYVSSGYNVENPNIAAILLELIQTWHMDIPGALGLLLGLGFLIACVFTAKISSHRVPLPLVTVAWCIAELLIQWVLPFKRVWLFFLPFYLIYASGGLVGVVHLCAGFLRDHYPQLTQKISNTFPRNRFSITHGGNLVAVMLALLISAGLSWNVIQSKSVLYDKETGILRDAVQVSQFLKPYVESGIPVYQTSPSSNILGYYFLEFNRPGTRDEKKKIIVVNRDYGQDLDKVAGYYFHLPDAEISRAVLLKAFDSALIYEIVKE